MGEKAATSEVISKLVSARGDENWNGRRSACRALVKMGEKAATSEVISKLVSALGHENEDVRKSACEALGKMGEKAATSEVISKLVSALGDENRNVRYIACEALGKMGEKAATSEVISKLVSALGDEEWLVRDSACEALVKMGEKAATSEVIKKLLEMADSNKPSKYYDWHVVEKLLTSFTTFTALDSDTVVKFLSCIDRGMLEDVRFVSPEMLIKVFLYTKSSVWLSIATQVTLLQGACVTVVRNTLVVYGSKEPVKLDCNDQKLLDELVNAFVKQALKLDLPCTGPTKADVSIDQEKEFPGGSPSVVRPDPQSSVCSVL